MPKLARLGLAGAAAVIGWLGLLAGADGGLASPIPAASAQTTGIPATNDTYLGLQWNLAQVGAAQAWATSKGRGIDIGVVDTGVDLSHPDLAGKVVASTDCTSAGGDPNRCSGTGQDDNGHGTHIAGIAAADTGNGIGVAGMAPDAKLVVAKALDRSGTGNFASVNAAIMWVVNHGARVVNLSLGVQNSVSNNQSPGPQSIGPGIEYAWSHGAVPVLAAGNTAKGQPATTATSYLGLNAIVVGATGRDGQVASYSSPLATAKWAVVAPGGSGYSSTGAPYCGPGREQENCIISTYLGPGAQGAYAWDEGTSMAAPLVSGTVALLLGLGETPSQAVRAILASAQSGVACGYGCAGRLDAARAVTEGVKVASTPGTLPGGVTSASSVGAVPGPGTSPRTMAQPQRSADPALPPGSAHLALLSPGAPSS
ncbi:MAG: S8 family serine peptidase, partial [Acidimicrobiales bacterium]